MNVFSWLITLKVFKTLLNKIWIKKKLYKNQQGKWKANSWKLRIQKLVRGDHYLIEWVQVQESKAKKKSKKIIGIQSYMNNHVNMTPKMPSSTVKFESNSLTFKHIKKEWHHGSSIFKVSIILIQSTVYGEQWF